MKAKATYSVIKFDVKKKLNITLTEYILMDIIFYLQQNKGYCYASKKYLSEALDISDRSIFKTIDKLIEKKLLIKDEKTKFLKTTNLWNNTAYLQDYEQNSYEQSAEQSMNKVHTDYEQSAYSTMNKVHTDYEQSSHNNNIYINNNNNINTNKKLTAKNFENKFSNVEKLSNKYIIDTKSEEFPESEKKYFDVAKAFNQMLINKFAEYNINNNQNLLKAKVGGWCKPIKQMIDIDKRTKEEFIKIWQFLKNEKPNENGFVWFKNIQSMEKLRKQFDKILIETSITKKANRNEMKRETAERIMKDLNINII